MNYYFCSSIIFYSLIKIAAADYRDVSAAEHNKYRRLHEVPNVFRHFKLDELAQKEAEYLAKNGFDERSEVSTVYGRNIHATWIPSATAEHLLKSAIESWYEEEQMYDYHVPRYLQETSTFTQLVWKGTKNIGTGVAVSKNGLFPRTFVVVVYWPPGNVLSQFKANVQKPINSIMPSTSEVPQDGFVPLSLGFDSLETNEIPESS